MREFLFDNEPENHGTEVSGWLSALVHNSRVNFFEYRVPVK